MLVRIVKMGFDPEKVEDFLQNFEANKKHIRNFPGCSFLELYRDKDEQNQFFTYSYWTNKEALEIYRKSELFQSVWAKTKVLFNQAPQAWSVEKLESLQ